MGGIGMLKKEAVWTEGDIREWRMVAVQPVHGGEVF
jgi:hypothetical protein